MKKNICEYKIAVCGSFGFMDIGDEAMLSEDINFIKTNLQIPKENIYLFGDLPDYVAMYHDHPRDRCFTSADIQQEYANQNKNKSNKTTLQSLKSIVKMGMYRNKHERENESIAAAKSCDVLLVTGGGTINTRDTEGWSITRIHNLVSFFRDLGKPVFMSGQTIGPLGLVERHDHFAREIINKIEFLSVRDNFYSRRYLKIIGAKPKKFVETFDDAYTLPYKDEVLPSEISQFVNKKLTFAVNVTDYTADKSEKRIFIAKLCETLITKYDVQIILVSNTPKDLYHLYMVYDMVKNNFKKSIMLPDTRLWKDSLLKKLISSCRIAIGGRYHFIVFAGTSNTPFVGMSGNHYSYIKQDGFARILGLEDFILSEKDTWDMAVVMTKVKTALKTKLDLESKFQRPSVSMQHFGHFLNDLEKED